MTPLELLCKRLTQDLPVAAGAFVLDSCKTFLFACTLYWDQHPSVEQPEQEEPPAEIQDITPRNEEVHGEDPVNRDEEEEKDASEGCFLLLDILRNVYTVLPSTENYLLIGSTDFICPELSVLIFLYN
ncbi:hypothetical protein MG293_005700 [Ovis ammon polii]|uniref:Uncharacterized protein n=1 Tax=Ovis ammon polii TaxID=230172 RepID=A0AAD4UKG6_OVIAM|nr:hypothetical protein MG293_005700 [Ovis ammon polii]